MALDVHSPKITMAALFTLGTLVFYSGGLTYKISKNESTNTTQWRYINTNSDKIESVVNEVSEFKYIARDMADARDTNKKMVEAVTRLTAVMEAYGERSARDREDRLKAENFMMTLSKEISEIKVKGTRIEAITKKN